MTSPMDRSNSVVGQVFANFNFSLRSLARISQPRVPTDLHSPRSNADVSSHNDALLHERDPELPSYRSRELDDLLHDVQDLADSPLPDSLLAELPGGLDPLVAVEMEASGLESQPAAAARVHRHRAKKASHNPVNLRSWVKLDASGELAMIQADKYKITHELGVQTRDLRLLEPNPSATFPSAILDRERAIVVNLEFIKCIITMDCVYVVNPEDDHVPPLISELKTKLAGGKGGMGKARSYPSALADVAAKIQFGKGVSIELPFELKALEVCLDSITSHLDVQASDLEAAAYPCLDNLTNRVSTKNLERVRRIKNRMVRLSTRVETILEVLEKFLDDDADMHKLNLTAKEMSRQASAAEDEQRAGSRRVSGSGSSSSSNSSTDSEDEAQVAEVEMLLEAYFMHVDHTHNRLETLHEYIKDTEDLVNIRLDQHRNQLITIDLIITAVTTVLTCMNVVHGYFGMNLVSGMLYSHTTFLKVIVGTCASGTAAFALFIIWCWYMRLIVF